MRPPDAASIASAKADNTHQRREILRAMPPHERPDFVRLIAADDRADWWALVEQMAAEDWDAVRAALEGHPHAHS